MSGGEPIILNDRYEVQQRIGRGGMADVFLARDVLLDRMVAIKVLFPEFATEEAQRRIPDPNKPETFERSRPAFDTQDDWARDWLDLHRRLLTLRRAAIMPRLEGARADGAQALTTRALQARWILGDGSALTLAANFGPEPVRLMPVPGKRLFALGPQGDCLGLAGKSFLAILDEKP